VGCIDEAVAESTTLAMNVTHQTGQLMITYGNLLAWLGIRTALVNLCSVAPLFSRQNWLWRHLEHLGTGVPLRDSRVPVSDCPIDNSREKRVVEPGTFELWIGSARESFSRLDFPTENISV
jgi:hypothetical protein